MKRLFLFALLVVVSWNAAPSHASDSAAWSVWLYAPTCPAPKIVRVGLDGSSDIQPFGCPDGGDFPAPVAFSSDMTRMAYCKYGSVRIVDFAEDFNFHIEINDNGDCSITPEGFDNADKRLLAVGTTHYVDATRAAPPRAYGELLILDVDRVAVTARLSTDDAALAPGYRRSYPNTADMPYVRAFEGGRVVFSPIRWGSELPPRFTSVFAWELETQRVTVTRTEGQWGEDRLPNGESVWYDANPGLPQAVSVGQASAYNTVLWAAPGIEPRIVYTAPLSISETVFIDGGRRIAFRVAAFDRPARWLALDRSGGVLDLALSPTVTAVVGTPDGYLYLDTPDGAPTSLYRVGLDGQAARLWQDGSSLWRLARHTPLPMPADPLPPFPMLRGS